MTQSNKDLPRRVDPYSWEALSRLIRPNSVAIVGASERPGAFGARALQNLAEFPGNVYPINPRHTSLNGRTAYPDLAALPESPDVVLIAVPAAGCEQIVREAAEVRAGGAIVFAGGFAETGLPQDADNQQKLTEIAQQFGMPVLGPNCIGICTAAGDTMLTFHQVPHRPKLSGKSIGIVSQSGGLGFAMAQSSSRGVGISHILTSGNSSDVDVADLVAFCADDPDCDAVLCLFEGVAVPERMVAAARRARAAGKPLIVHKQASSQAGQAAALSHTGSMAGSHAAWRAALEAEGAVMVDSFDYLVDVARFHAKAGRATARGVGAVATSGGGAILVSDAAERAGVALPKPGPELRAVMEAHVPIYGTRSNPADITPDVLNNPGSLAACTEAFLTSPDHSTLVIPQVTAARAISERLPVYDALGAAAGKVISLVWQNDWIGGEGVDAAEAQDHVAFFRSMEGCMATIAGWHRHSELQEMRDGEQTFLRAALEARAEVARLLADGASRTLTEKDAKHLLSLYGVAVPQEAVARDAEAAIAAAERFGRPVAMKVLSELIPHKTEMGGVKLGLKAADEVAEAFAQIAAATHAHLGNADDVTVLVQPMAPKGLEILVGGVVDAALGPMLIVGMGGVFVEMLQDFVQAQAPVSVEHARLLLGELRSAHVLDGFRDLPPVDVDALSRMIAGISELLADHAGAIAELDVNPIICAGDTLHVVDAMIARSVT